ncbi:MAG: 30S ribosomal protein S17 [Chloroflexota bacterium]
MPNNRKRLQGVVVSNKMDKTVAVEIERLKAHRVYEKVLTSTKKVLAHDESNEIPLGAIVRIVESKPLSKRKRWVVEEVLVDPGNKVVESISDEQEVLEAEQIGREEAEADDAETGDEEA